MEEVNIITPEASLRKIQYVGVSISSHMEVQGGQEKATRTPEKLQKKGPQHHLEKGVVTQGRTHKQAKSYN